MTSLAERLAHLDKTERDAVLDDLSDEEAEALERDWLFWAREEQQAPPEPWSVAWYSGGRGSGKTRAGAEIAAQWCRDFPDVDGGIVAPTFQADALRKCVEGESGILNALGGEGGPLVERYNRGEGVLYLRSGRSIFATGADKGALRVQGENLGWCWCDEVGLWPRGTWDTAWNESIQFAVRKAPAKIVCTGTPKAGHPLVKLLNEDEAVVKRRLRTVDNVANLDDAWAKRIVAKYEGTRLGAQELEGVLIAEVEGALWLWVWIEKLRMAAAPVCARIVVGVDPSGGANEIGNVAAGVIKSPCPCGKQDEKGPHYAVLQDRSLLASPERWGRAVVDLYDDLGGDRVVAERNFGGEMVESTIRVADPSVPVKMVNASRGKAQRAEPISALAEQGRIHHCGTFADLETELTTWVPGDDWSPNRLDAYVWALTELSNRGDGTATVTKPRTRLHDGVGGGG